MRPAASNRNAGEAPFPDVDGKSREKRQPSPVSQAHGGSTIAEEPSRLKNIFREAHLRPRRAVCDADAGADNAFEAGPAPVIGGAFLLSPRSDAGSVADTTPFGGRSAPVLNGLSAPGASTASAG